MLAPLNWEGKNTFGFPFKPQVCMSEPDNIRNVEILPQTDLWSW